MIQNFYYFQNERGDWLRTNGRSGSRNVKSWTEKLSHRCFTDTMERALAIQKECGGTIVVQPTECFDL